MPKDTGQGASAVFSVSLLTFPFTTIDMTDETLPAVNTSDLSAVGFETYMPGDLTEPGTVTFELQNDPQLTQVVIGAVETLTITMPLSEASGTAGTWVGTGFLTSYKPPNFVKNELQVGSVTFQFDGLTGPTLTPEVPPV